MLKEKLGFDRKTLDGALASFTGSAQGRNRLWLLFVLGQWSRRWL